MLLWAPKTPAVKLFSSFHFSENFSGRGAPYQKAVLSAPLGVYAAIQGPFVLRSILYTFSGFRFLNRRVYAHFSGSNGFLVLRYGRLVKSIRKTCPHIGGGVGSTNGFQCPHASGFRHTMRHTKQPFCRLCNRFVITLPAIGNTSTNGW